MGLQYQSIPGAEWHVHCDHIGIHKIHPLSPSVGASLLVEGLDSEFLDSNNLDSEHLESEYEWKEDMESILEIVCTK